MTAGAAAERADRILQGGRSKAYRPLPLTERRRAVRAGLAAYRRGDYFEAHELLEPAWMGTRDLPEREALQGLIKLAAAYVHAVRGNATGVAKNLAGAQDRLDAALAGNGSGASGVPGVDIAALVRAIAARRRTLADAAAGATHGPLDSSGILALVPPPPLGRGR